MHYYLVTTFNHQAYVLDMLASIQAQYPDLEDFRRRAQVLVVDDASSDHTAQLLLAAASGFPNLKVFVNPVNRGIGFNRNLLLEWVVEHNPASEDAVLFVDGDDLLPPGAVSVKLQALSADPDLDVVGGQLELFYGNDVTNRHRVDTFALDPDMQRIASLFECHFYISNALFRARVFLDPAVRFPEVPACEDWLFFSMFPLRMAHVPNVTLYYRRHDNNLTSAPASQTTMGTLRVHTRATGFLRMGMLLSEQERGLLDLVSHLSFRIQWKGTRSVPRTDVRMPWFPLLAKRADIVRQWPTLRGQLESLFQRMKEHNNRMQGYHPAKLHRFLDAILTQADLEVRLAEPAEASASV